MNTIYFSRSRLRLTSLVLIALMLALQSAFALSAGFMLQRAATVAVDEPQTMGPSCHDTRPSLDPARKLCQAHCMTEGQSLDPAEIPLLAPSLEAPPILVLQAVPASKPILPAFWRSASSHDPPISIRFCSFLI